MDFPNQGSSVYYEIQCTYIRQSEGELLTVEGRCAEKVRAIWPQIWHTKTTREGCIERKILSSGDETAVYELDISKTPYNQAIQPNLPHEEHSACSNEGSVVRLHELHRQGQREVIGVLSLTSARGHSLKDNFRDWAGLYILSESRICAPVHEIGMDASKSKDLAERITVLFELRLRNVAPHDAWISGGGRKYFLDRVLAFVERKATVEFCLPAFPCKSSNPFKTSGVYPDKAEVIALEALRHFVRGVTEIYEPGAKVWIISDGHVFSDCIGVDDTTVDAYGEKLFSIERREAEKSGQPSTIEYLSLPEMFFANKELEALFKNNWAEDVDVPHYVETRRTARAELCRQLLMALCQADRDVLRSLIKGSDGSSLALYRGFSRFMLEDLALHPSCARSSQSQRKKLATKVAFEMIMRNQAYSNLVELLFPQHVRLSIHAHSNEGPKFGIRLFPSKTVRAVESLLKPDEQHMQDLLHTPTPWHNCIVKVEGHQTLYLAKSRVVSDAVDSDAYEARWMVDGGDVASGYYLLWKKPRVRMDL